MVRTKADSVPGTYRKGEAMRRGSGGLGFPHPAAAEGGRVGGGPSLSSEAAAQPLKEEEEAERAGEGSASWGSPELGSGPW